MIKRLLWLLVLFVCVAPYASAQQGLQGYVVTGTGAQARIVLTGSAIVFHQLTWNVTGTVSSCTVALDTSADGVSWSAGNAIAGQTCTSNGQSALSTSAVFNFVRVNTTAFSGTGSVVITWAGYVATPGGLPSGCTSPGTGAITCTGTVKDANTIATSSIQAVGAAAQAMNLYVSGGCDGISACTGFSWGFIAPVSLVAPLQYTGNLTDGSGNSAFVTDGSQHLSTVQLPQYIAGAGVVNVMTATYVPAFSAYAAGEEFDVLPNLANTTTNPTLNVNSLGAKTVTKCGTAALLAGDYSTTAIAKFIYDGTGMQLQNPVSGCAAIPIGNVGSSGLSGTAPVTINAAGAIGCATCATTTTFTSPSYWMLPLGGAPSELSVAAEATAANQMRCYRFFLPLSLTVSRLVWRFTAASGNYGVAIYDSPGTTRLITTGAQTGGVSSFAVGPTTLAPNFYLMCWTQDNGVGTWVASVSGNSTTVNDTTVQVGNAANASVAGAPPATTGAITGATNGLLNIKLQ